MTEMHPSAPAHRQQNRAYRGLHQFLLPGPHHGSHAGRAQSPGNLGGSASSVSSHQVADEKLPWINNTGIPSSGPANRTRVVSLSGRYRMSRDAVENGRHDVCSQASRTFLSILPMAVKGNSSITIIERGCLYLARRSPMKARRSSSSYFIPDHERAADFAPGFMRNTDDSRFHAPSGAPAAQIQSRPDRHFRHR